MKKKSKRICVMAICLWLLLLPSCTFSPLIFSYDELKLTNTVVKVELIYYNQPEVSTVSDILGNASRRHQNFNFNLVESVKYLDRMYYELFFEELSSIDMQNAVRQNNSPSGLTILLHYENGNFDAFSSPYLGRFDSKGKFIEYLGDGVVEIRLRAIVDRYFDYSPW